MRRRDPVIQISNPLMEKDNSSADANKINLDDKVTFTGIEGSEYQDARLIEAFLSN